MCREMYSAGWIVFLNRLELRFRSRGAEFCRLARGELPILSRYSRTLLLRLSRRYRFLGIKISRLQVTPLSPHEYLSVVR